MSFLSVMGVIFLGLIAVILISLSVIEYDERQEEKFQDESDDLLSGDDGGINYRL